MACTREVAVYGFNASKHDEGHGGHSNDQLVVFGLSIVMIGGAFVKAISSRYSSLPFTVMLLMFGVILAVWTIFDQQFTLQPGSSRWQI